jgi:hypothetical protein
MEKCAAPGETLGWPELSRSRTNPLPRFHLTRLISLLTWRPEILSFTPHEAGHPERARTNASFTEPNQEKYMKRLALVAVVLVAACSTKETPKADTAAPAMAPAPAPVAVDTTAKTDSAMASMKMDTAKAKMDTAGKKVDEAKGAMKDAGKAAAKATKKP